MNFDMQEQYDKIYRYCYFKLQHRQTAEDITQETFLKYFAQSRYINRGKPLAYLYTIAKNLCIDFYRKSIALPFNENLPCETDNIVIDECLDVKNAVQGLTKDLQELVILRYVNELSIGEIIAITGLSRFAIYRKLNKAIEALKQKLDEKE